MDVGIGTQSSCIPVFGLERHLLIYAVTEHYQKVRCGKWLRHTSFPKWPKSCPTILPLGLSNPQPHNRTYGYGYRIWGVITVRLQLRCEQNEPDTVTVWAQKNGYGYGSTPDNTVMVFGIVGCLTTGVKTGGSVFSHSRIGNQTKSQEQKR
jgi:hypothetical protein